MDNPTVLIVVAVVVGIVLLVGIILALSNKGGMFRFKSKYGDVEAGREERGKTTVGESLEAKDAEFGNVTGVDTQGPAPSRDDAEVLKGAKVERTKMGDIIGKKHEQK